MSVAKRAAYKVFAMMPGTVRRRIVKVVGPTFSVGALAVILDGQGNAAMVRQPHTTGWGLPGGLLEKGEPATTTLHREIREELGLPIDALGLPDAPSTALVDHARGRIDLIFFGRLAPDALAGARGSDGLEVQWRPLDETEVILAAGEILAFVRAHLPTT